MPVKAARDAGYSMEEARALADQGTMVKVINDGQTIEGVTP